MDIKNIAILFITLVILSLVVISYSTNKQITSIYTYEGFSSENERLAGVVHSGDLIEIATSEEKDAKFMNRQDYNSEIVFSTPQEKGVNTNLSKLRLVAANHADKSIQMPLKFGDTVMLAHNAYIENKNQTRYVKYGEKLQSHQDGELFRTYKIINPSNKNDNSVVKYNSPIVLARSENFDSSYLTIEANGSVSSKSSLDKASKMIIKLRRVYEPYEKNLCVCQNEILYP